jgi:hypothetical protein
MADIKTFGSFEEMLEDLHKNREAADARVGPEALQYKPGGYYLRYIETMRVFVYGEIYDPVEEDRKLGASEEELDYLRKVYEQEHMKHYRATKSYSVMCEEGEHGDVHVSTMLMPLTEEEFERARGLGWPNEGPSILKKVLRMSTPVGEVPKA